MAETDELRETEFRVYVLIVVSATALVAVLRLTAGDFDSISGAVRYASVLVNSMKTSTGLPTADFDN